MEIVTTTLALGEVCRALAAEPFVAVDTEFMRETTYWPNLCLVQLAGEGREIIVDPLAPGLELEPFFALMTDERVLKVFHAGRQDVEILVHRGGIIPHPLFDTQIAAMVCGFGEQVSYENLVRRLTGAGIDKSSQFTDWSRRPLAPRQLRYAASDVTHLRAVYRKLRAELDRTGREPWLEAEMAVLTAPETYANSPDMAWRRIRFRPRSKRSLAVFMELAAWREREAQARNVPRNRVLKDDALAEIAVQMPKDADAFARLRAVPRGFTGGRMGEALMEAVERGLARSPDSLPEIAPNEGPVRDRIAPVLDLLKVALKTVCARAGVATKLVASSDDIEAIALDDEADVPALKGWRRELYGEAALAIKHGRLAIAIEDGEAVLIDRAPAGRPHNTIQAAE